MDVHFVRTFSTHGVHVIHTTHHNGQIILRIPSLRKETFMSLDACNLSLVHTYRHQIDFKFDPIKF